MIWFEPYTLEQLHDMGRDGGLAPRIGIEITEIGDDYMRGTMPVDERTKQPFGILHGGASCVLSETLGSIAAWMCIDPTKFYAVGLEINANHIRSMREGEVTGTCRPLHIGRRTHIWQTEILDPRGKLVCVSRLTVAILPREE